MFRQNATRLAFVALIGAGMVSLTGCNDDDDHVSQTQVAPQAKSVVELAQSSAELSVLVEAVAAADLVSALSTQNENTPLTVFAPTNQAFTQLLTGLGMTKEQLLADKALLTKVLTYHVIPKAAVEKADIPLNQSLVSLNGAAFVIDDRLQVKDSQGGIANISRTDLRSDNGIVHVIDRVLLPPMQSIAEIASNNPDFSILVEALAAVDLVETFQQDGNFTVFAPTNAAFAALLTELDLTKEQLFADEALLATVLKYHVIPEQRVFASQISAGQEVTSLQTGKFRLNTTTTILDGRGRTANLVLTDVQANNGVIHAIDRVILPPLPPTP